MILPWYSRYIKESYKPYIDQFFPNNQFAELETGHWGESSDFSHSTCSH